MKPILTMAALVVALSAGAALAQNKPTRSISVDDSFQDANVRWSGGNPGGYQAKISLKVNKGVFELCGVGVATNIQLRPTIDKMLRGCKLNINGKIVLKNCSYFAKARSKGALTSTKANCARTSIKAQKIDLIDFQYGNSTFRN